ncbi:MAG: methyltransferase family protein [Candidatus Hodarchaeales archaeon]|jgi:protein-S-isoprenylcysteine O-methyltransferase Ste14
MAVFRYVKGFVLEPFLGIFVVPLVILFIFSDIQFAWTLNFPMNVVILTLAIGLLIAGVLLMIITTYLFAKIGHGSAAPWDPPSDLVVHGIYRYVRNPMVVGVLLTVLGEAFLFGSMPLFALFVALWIGNHILFVKSEEPELIQRFGSEYVQYMENVPRWIPRRNPWTNSSDTESHD